MQPTFFSFIALLQKVRTLIIKLLQSRNYDNEIKNILCIISNSINFAASKFTIQILPFSECLDYKYKLSYPAQFVLFII